MDIESMKYYGIKKSLDKADYFVTDNYKIMLDNVKFAAKTGGLIALTGIVGVGKTTALRHLQQAIKEENKVLVCKSLATDKRNVTINTLYTALFADLITKKDANVPMQPEKRERKLQTIIKEFSKPIALFIDEAHDLSARTLVSLKHLIETVQDVNGILSVVLVGHPKLANDLRNPALEEIGARAKIFEIGSLGTNSPKFIEWLLRDCSEEGVNPSDILSQEVSELFAQQLITPLQVTYYITRVLEKGYQIAEKPISLETARSVLSPDLSILEAKLARNGYNVTTLCDYLNIRRHEVKSYLRGQLSQSRLEELNKEVHKLGVVL